jgi:hypothetical protein
LKDFTWKVFPSGDHFLLDVGRLERPEIAFSRGYVEGFSMRL